MSATVTPITQRQSMLAYAQTYARLGWHVLPLLPGTKRPFSRLVPNGFHNATREAETIEKWWTAEPTAGIGIALKASGLVAVDVDHRNGGFDTLGDLEAAHGKLESDAHQLTGDGGWHLVFSSQLTESLPGTLGRGIDLKADGYICAEPTIHPNGKTYEWEASSSPLDGCVPSTLPGWIRDMSRTPVAPVTFSNAPMAPTPRWLDCLAALPHVKADERETWLHVGMAIHNERPDGEGYRAWSEWSATSPKFDAKDQSRVWLSFKRRGLSGTTLNSVFAMAQQGGWKNEAKVIPLPPVSNGSILKRVAQLRAESQNLTWAVKHIVPDASIGMIFGASKTFKSFIALDYALHRTYGLKWMGKRTKQGIPVYLAAEGSGGILRRIDAWHLERGMDSDQCPMETVTVTLDLTTQAAYLREQIEAAGVQPSDIIIDTMSQTFTGEENSAREVSVFFNKLASELRDTFKCVVLVIHHTGKSDGETARGSGVMLNNVDFQFRVERDEPALMSTLTCVKQKDEESFDPVNFVLKRHVLGHDDEGDEISSLSASVVNHAADLLEASDKAAETDKSRYMRLLDELGNEEQANKEFKKTLHGAGRTKGQTDTALSKAKKHAKACGYQFLADGSVTSPRWQP